MASNASYWGGRDRVPGKAVTAGMNVLLGAKKILLLVSGEHKHAVLRRTLYGPVTPRGPGFLLANRRERDGACRPRGLAWGGCRGWINPPALYQDALYQDVTFWALTAAAPRRWPWWPDVTGASSARGAAAPGDIYEGEAAAFDAVRTAVGAALDGGRSHERGAFKKRLQHVGRGLARRLCAYPRYAGRGRLRQLCAWSTTPSARSTRGCRGASA